MERSISANDQRQAPFVYFDVELDDANLNPYEFRIYSRIARRAGGGDHYCSESLSSMASGCQMSTRSVIRAIQELAKRRMIRRVAKQGEVSRYALLDKKYWIASDSQSQVVVTHSHGGCDSQSLDLCPTVTGGVTHSHTKNTKKKTTKKTSKETEAPASPEPAGISANHPAIQFVRSITSRYPDKALWQSIAELLGESFDQERARRCYASWVGRGWNKMNFGWLFEWYKNGEPQQPMKGNTTYAKTGTGTAQDHSAIISRFRARTIE